MTEAEASAGDGNDFSLIYVVGRVNQGILREMRARLAELELSVQEYTALSVLKARPGLSNAQLARRSLVTPQSMIEILAKLEQRGLVARSVDPAHGRILHAQLTPAAKRLLARADPRIAEVQDKLFSNASEDEQGVVLRTMLAAMGRLSTGLDA